jgi:hypothetical protein
MSLIQRAKTIPAAKEVSGILLTTVRTPFLRCTGRFVDLPDERQGLLRLTRVIDPYFRPHVRGGQISNAPNGICIEYVRFDRLRSKYVHDHLGIGKIGGKIYALHEICLLLLVDRRERDPRRWLPERVKRTRVFLPSALAGGSSKPTILNCGVVIFLAAWISQRYVSNEYGAFPAWAGPERSRRRHHAPRLRQHRAQVRWGMSCKTRLQLMRRSVCPCEPGAIVAGSRA